jgi:TM2 domain-containing membrane protein YozV
MDCANHSGVNATAYCQNCGKPMCQTCVRNAPGGQIFCETCMTAWSAAANAHPFYTAQPGAPSPPLAAVLGVIPGVGAMYNGQFIKGLMHVLIFAVLVSAAHVFGIFGLLIAGWVCYQVFDAYHTAKARRDGEPLPDPLGLNDVGSWLGVGARTHGTTQNWTHPGATPNPGAGQTGPGTATGAASGTSTGPTSGYPGGAYPPPYESAYHPGTQQPSGWQTPYQGTAQGFVAGTEGIHTGGSPTNPGAGPIPPVPPVPPTPWRRPEPIGAVILIALGALFLLDKFDFLSGRVFEFTWPVVLIGLGVWMIVRNVGRSQGGQQ